MQLPFGQKSYVFQSYPLKKLFSIQIQSFVLFYIRNSKPLNIIFHLMQMGSIGKYSNIQIITILS